MRKTRFASILATLFILGGSTVFGATSSSIQLKNTNNNSVRVILPNVEKDIYGIQIELTTKEALTEDVLFQPKDKDAYSFTVRKGNTITIYITSNKVLNVGKEAILGDLIDMRNEQFVDQAKLKVVDYFLTPTETPNVDIEYTEEETENGDSSKPEENPSVPEETPNKPVQPEYTEEDNKNWGNSGGIQKPVDPVVPEKPVEQETPVTPETPETPSIPVVEFSDVKQHWAKESINKMAKRGVLRGYEDGTFGPSRQITRAEFAAVITRAFGFEETVTSLPFKDTVVGKWYTEPVGTLYQKGIIAGLPDGTFGVNTPITNQEMAVMISRAIKVAGADLDKQRDYTDFTDAATISPYAQESVKELYELGLISGMPDGTYQPKASSTRAQVAVIVDRILTMIESK